MTWEPVNLTQICPAHSQLTACSYFGYVYLHFITDLFGDSIDRRIQEQLAIGQYGDKIGISESFKNYPYNMGAKEIIDDEEYDFIVVGAGAAGCVVANRLVEKNFNVLLLEAGGEQPDITLVPALSTALLGSNIDWNYFTKPNGISCLGRQGQQCAWARGKTMGGSSSINSMAYIRGNRLDYDSWAAMGNEGWSYKDVLPLFIKAENNLNIHSLDKGYHGAHGEQWVSYLPYTDQPSFMMTRAFNEMGLHLTDFNGAHQAGAVQGQTFSRFGERVSTNTAYIQPIRYKRKNLTVKINSEVMKILINENNVAYGVVYVNNGKQYTAFAKNEVISSAGAINSPKLLMLSGIGPKSHLQSLGINVISNLAVGYNLQDHVTFNGYTVLLPKENTTLVDAKEVFNDILHYKLDRIKNGPIAGNGATNTMGFLKTDPSLPAPDIQYQCSSVVLKEYLSNPPLYESLSTLPTAYYDAIMPRTMNLVPKSRGRIYLNETNPFAYPIIHANYLSNAEDFIPIIKGVRFLLSLENSKAFKDMGARFSRDLLPGCTEYEWGSDEYTSCLLRVYTSTSYHPCGTCKMGPHFDKSAVVDPRLRVYGVSRLRVIDSSIMPVIVRGNLNAPSIMIGEKGANMILEDWGVTGGRKPKIY